MMDAELFALSEENLRAAEAFARLLQVGEPLYAPDEIQSFSDNCGLPPHEAFLLLIAAALGMEDDRCFIRRFLSPAIRPLETAPYRENPYRRLIRFPEATEGKWALTHLKYAPYQLFPCGSMQVMADGREIPPIGYFPEAFSYPAVLENGREWMTVTPNEIATMEPAVAAARGRIAVFGLGLGYFTLMASEKKSVSSVTVIERDPAAIALFRRHLLPQFPHREKITLIQADAFDHLQNVCPQAGYDFGFVDLWHDVGDGIGMYLRCRQLAALSPRTEFHYWIEQDLLLFLKGLMIEDHFHHEGTLDRLLPSDVSAVTIDFLRTAALRVRPEEVK